MAETAPGRGRMIERVRERKERHRQRGRAYRIAFGIAGFAVLLGGVALSLPLVPGPGVPLIAVGLAMLALEFAWAERLLERVLDRVEQMGERASQASRGQKAVAGAATAACASAAVAVAILWDVPGLPI